jgi:hypothetical protein
MLEDLQIRNCSPTIIRICLPAMAEFAQHFGKPPDLLGAERSPLYQVFLIFRWPPTHPFSAARRTCR